MLSVEAIKEIQAADATSKLGELLDGQLTPIVAVPHNFSVESLEHYGPSRVRHRGKFSTNSIDAFIAFVGGFERKLPVFVSDRSMSAEAIFNYEEADGAQGHCDYKANLSLVKTAEFEALLSMDQRTHEQRKLAEFLEDYRDNIICYDSEGEALDIKKSIAAVRRITINSSAEQESTQEDYSSSKSRLEKHTANSNVATLPTGFRFTCEPYNGLPQRSFDVRIALRGGDEVELTLKIKLLEKQQELIAKDFAQVIEGGVSDNVSVYLGSFNA